MVDCTIRLGADGIVVGIDGGGSRTAVWCGPADDPGAVREAAGSCNVTTLGVDGAGLVLEATLDRALSGLEAARGDVAACVAGLAGVDAPALRAAMGQRLARLLPNGRVAIHTDIELALAGGVGQGPGIAVVSGTGSIALARGRDGTLARAGGWGAAFGDPGSGYAIGMGALRAVIRAADGLEPPTALTDAVLASLGLDDAGDLRHRPPGVPEAAGLVPVVVRCAVAGDQAAAALLDRAGQDLAELVVAAAAAAGLAGAGVCLALAGGVLVHVEPVRRALILASARRGTMPDRVVSVPEPAAAAAALAARLAQSLPSES